MLKIDFYILEEEPLARLHFVCKLIEKAYKEKHRIYVHAKNETEAHKIDELLWVYRDDSFLPHNLYGEGPTPPPSIQIGFHSTPDNHKDILINLSGEIPVFFQQFKRILEIVCKDEAIQKVSRAHYREYRAQGYSITTHKITTSLSEIRQ